MRIEHVFNNNIIRVRDGDLEVIVTGLGIGFHARAGDPVDEAKIEKRFVLEQSPNAPVVDALVADLPYEILQLADRLSALASERLGLALKPYGHFALADHLNAAVERSRKGDRIDNPLLWEIRSAYRDEFGLGLEMLRLVSEETNLTLPIDEAGYLAMHLVNASLTGSMPATLRATETVQTVIRIIREEVGITAPPSSNDFLRFITHIKYFVQRLEEGKPLVGADDEMFDLLRARDPQVYAAARATAAYANGKYAIEVPNEELLYLMLHIHRIHRPLDTE